MTSWSYVHSLLSGTDDLSQHWPLLLPLYTNVHPWQPSCPWHCMQHWGHLSTSTPCLRLTPPLFLWSEGAQRSDRRAGAGVGAGSASRPGQLPLMTSWSYVHSLLSGTDDLSQHWPLLLPLYTNVHPWQPSCPWHWLQHWGHLSRTTPPCRDLRTRTPPRWLRLPAEKPSTRLLAEGAGTTA